MEMPSSDRRCAALISGGVGRHSPRWELLSRQPAKGAGRQELRVPRPASRSPSIPVQEARTFWPCSRNSPCGRTYL